MPNALLAIPAPEDALIAKAFKALDEARTPEELKKVRDGASLFADWVRKRHGSITTIRAANEIKLRAERKLGGVFKALTKSKGGRPRKNPLQPATGFKSKMEAVNAAGSNKSDAHKCEAIFELPEKRFEKEIAGGWATTMRLVRIRKTEYDPEGRYLTYMARFYEGPPPSIEEAIRDAIIMAGRCGGGLLKATTPIPSDLQPEGVMREARALRDARDYTPAKWEALCRRSSRAWRGVFNTFSDIDKVLHRFRRHGWMKREAPPKPKVVCARL